MIAAVFATVAAWFCGLFIDANLQIGVLGFLELRILFPILTMGGFIIHNLNRK